jgi:hypothetical protein
MFYKPAVSLSPVVTFSFIDPGLESMDSFRTHLDAYLTLFTKLSQVRFYYVALERFDFHGGQHKVDLMVALRGRVGRR